MSSGVLFRMSLMTVASYVRNDQRNGLCHTRSQVVLLYDNVPL